MVVSISLDVPYLGLEVLSVRFGRSIDCLPRESEMDLFVSIEGLDPNLDVSDFI